MKKKLKEAKNAGILLNFPKIFFHIKYLTYLCRVKTSNNILFTF